jgi:thioredoxin-like negative regulator of GroEL
MNQPNQSPRRAPRIIEAAPAGVSRGWRWAAALPAIIALTTSVACAALLVTRSPAHELPWYEQLAKDALANHDYDLASVCYQRLLLDEPNNPEHELGLAMSLAATGQGREARQLLARLAPSDSAGYLPARRFLAEQLLAAPSPTPKMLEAALAQLKWLVDAQPDDFEVHALLAKVYADQGQWEKCKIELAKTGPRRPVLEDRLLPHSPPGTGGSH